MAGKARPRREPYLGRSRPESLTAIREQDRGYLCDGGGDTVNLVGSSAAAGQETIGGVTFDVYTFTGTQGRLLAEAGDVLVV